MVDEGRRAFLFGLGALVLDIAIEGTAFGRARRRRQARRTPRIDLENSIDRNKLTLYFRTNSWELSETDLRDLSRFYRGHRRAASVIVEGHCDIRGSIEENLELGIRRAEGVAHYLNAFGYQGSINSVSYGEENIVDSGATQEAHRRNRRVIVIADEQILARALDLLPAEVYLIDATGSMQGNKWNTVVGYNYPTGVQLYTFNGCIGLRRVDAFRDIAPDCGTPLWDSVGRVVSNMQPNTRLTVLSDGDDNESSYRPQGVISLAREREVKISTIGIGVSDFTREGLTQVARDTGGRFYVSNQ